MNYVHSNLEPANILIGAIDEKPVVYLSDFSIARQYRHPRTRVHIPLRSGLPCPPTPVFSSINVDIGFEASRRDDIESLAYVLIYLFCGSLPWIHGRNSNNIVQMKRSISSAELCQGLPEGLKNILDYSRTLTFQDKPNYNILRSYVQIHTLSLSNIGTTSIVTSTLRFASDTITIPGMA